MPHTIMSKYYLKGKKAKRTKTAKRTKRRNNKRKLSRKRKHGGGQCTSKPAKPKETLLEGDITKLVKHFAERYKETCTQHEKDEFKRLLQEATFEPDVRGAKPVESKEGLGFIMDYNALFTPYEQIVLLMKDNDHQHQLMVAIKTRHIDN